MISSWLCVFYFCPPPFPHWEAELLRCPPTEPTRWGWLRSRCVEAGARCLQNCRPFRAFYGGKVILWQRISWAEAGGALLLLRRLCLWRVLRRYQEALGQPVHTGEPSRSNKAHRQLLLICSHNTTVGVALSKLYYIYFLPPHVLWPLIPKLIFELTH